MIDPHEEQRETMLARQLRNRGITSRPVLEAMAAVPRHWFVPPGLQTAAYEDRALPIDCQQTISQPYMVGLMTQSLGLSGGERVLEIGTGSGYQAAVLSQLAGEVYTMERHPDLAAEAALVLQKLGCQNVRLKVGDGARGWPEAAPFDRIIVTAAAQACPPALLEQLADPGRLLIPVGPGDQQELVAIEQRHGCRWTTAICPCRFVPLVPD